MKITKIVSLGHACDTTYQIRRHFKQGETYPFDWLMTPLNSIIELIDTRFQYFMQRNNLSLKSDFVEDLKYGIHFYHDFPEYRINDQTYADVYARYSRRIARFYNLAKSDNGLLFVRGAQYLDDERVVDANAAERLADCLARLCHNDNWLLLVQSPPLAGIPELTSDHIVMRQLPPPNPWRWQGDDQQWSALFDSVVDDRTGISDRITE